MESCIGVEWELVQVSDLSLLTKQVIKVVYVRINKHPMVAYRPGNVSKHRL